MALSKAPWIDAEVHALNAWQDFGMVHPFTCGTDGCGQSLIATNDGWVCPDCDYIQDWAHTYMVDGSYIENYRDAMGQFMHEGKSDEDNGETTDEPDTSETSSGR